MSATELIKKVAALPRQERMLFEQLFLALTNGSRDPVPVVHSSWPDFAERLRDIYGDKIAPDSQKIVNDGRGDN